MIYLSLFACVALLVGMNVGVRRNERTWPTVVALAAVGVWLTVSMMLPFPFWELAGLLLVLRVAVRYFDRPRLFLPLSLAAFAGVAVGNAGYAWAEVSELLARYPFESLADRLPPRPIVPTNEPVEETPERQNLFFSRNRGDYLRSLHTDTVGWFVSQPNFGVARMGDGKSPYGLRMGERHGPPLPQPVGRLPSGGAVPDAGTATSVGPHTGMHAAGVQDFVHLDGFGYVESRERVAGFQPHQFSKPPEPAGGLTLRALDLIGLVVHPEPVAYVSANLPRMDELRQNPTRPLTAFEADGVKALRTGDELYARRSADGTVRLVGAIRNAKDCQACHGGRRGDLLGAFAYELVPGGK